MTDKEPPDNAEPQSSPPDPEKPKPTSPSEILPPSLDKALRTAGVNLQDPDVTKTLEISLKMMMARSSLPLPPPAVLSDYNKEFPGLVDKIVLWTEEQRQHRMILENQVTTRAENRMDRGQLIAAGVAVIGLCLAALVGIVGNPYVAAAIGVVSTGGPTAAVYLARGDMTPRLRATSPASPRKMDRQTGSAKFQADQLPGLLSDGRRRALVVYTRTCWAAGIGEHCKISRDRRGCSTPGARRQDANGVIVDAGLDAPAPARSGVRPTWRGARQTIAGAARASPRANHALTSCSDHSIGADHSA